MKILVTGCSGFIGAAVCWQAQQLGYEIVGLDIVLPHFVLPNFKFVHHDLADAASLKTLLLIERPEAVLHCAAQTSVSESLARPHFYLTQNLVYSLNLLQAMGQAGICKLVFSSSAAVYGQVESAVPLTENSSCAPISPYGKSKLMLEQLLPDFNYTFGINSVALRYFNVAGSIVAPGFVHYENHQPETHLLPNLFKRVMAGLPVDIFGFELPTPDGSAVRDFVHLRDVATANLLAINFLRDFQGCEVFNICSGIGISVLQALQAVEKQLQQTAIIKNNLPRSGDAAVLVGNGSKAHQNLAWLPTHSNLNQIVASYQQKTSSH
jgi:UDP-glucose 4-epimerase